MIEIDGDRTITQLTDVTRAAKEGPDPHFGMQAPVNQTATVTTPGGLMICPPSYTG